MNSLKCTMPCLRTFVQKVTLIEPCTIIRRIQGKGGYVEITIKLAHPSRVVVFSNRKLAGRPLCLQPSQGDHVIYMANENSEITFLIDPRLGTIEWYIEN